MLDIGVGGNQEACRTCGRVLNNFPWLGFHTTHHGVDQWPWGEVLARTGFGFVGVLLQQAFIQVTEAIFLGVEPVDLIQRLDELLQMTGFPQAGLGIGINRGNQRIVVDTFAVAFPGGEGEQHLTVVVQQGDAGFLVQVCPAAALG